jgi:hypothetical protein
MLSTLIQANDCVFQILTNGLYVDVLCGKSFTVTVNTDEKETTTVGDGQYKTFDYKVLSYTANLNGAMKIPDDVNPTIFDMLALQQGFIEAQFRAVWVDPNGGTRFFAGKGIIKTTNIVASASQLADGTIDILGSGAFEVGDNIQELVNLTLICTGNNTATAFVKFKLLNVDGDTIFQTDILPQANGGNLANPFNITVRIPPGIYSIYWLVDTNTTGNTIAINTPVAYSQGFNNGINSYSSFPSPTYDFTAARTVTVTLAIDNPPPDCVPVSIYGNPPLFDAIIAGQYTSVFPLVGSAPFSISNVTKPSWMNIDLVVLSGITYAYFTGIADTEGTGIVVSLDFSNACGTVSYSDTIDVTNPGNLSTVTYSYDEESSGKALSCDFIAYLNGTSFPPYLLKTTDASGALFLNPGDTFEVRVVGPTPFGLGGTGAVKHIQVTDSIDGVIYNNTTENIINFSFTVISGHDYAIIATATNP